MVVITVIIIIIIIYGSISVNMDGWIDV